MIYGLLLFELISGSRVVARRIVHLSGLEVRDDNPYRDIEINYSGLCPGEKLFEELLIGEVVRGTERPHILRAHDECLPWRAFGKVVSRLQRDMGRSDIPALRSQLAELVTGYHPHGCIEDHYWRNPLSGA